MWLEKILGDDEDDSAFEENEQDNEIIRKIMAKNLEIEKDIKEIIKQEEKCTDIYNKKADELNSILDCEILSLENEALFRIKLLASLCAKMELKEPSVSNFLFGITEAGTRKIDQEIEEKKNNRLLSSLSKKVTHTIQTNEGLRRELKRIKEIVESQQTVYSSVKNEGEFLKLKTREYEYQIKKLKSKLESEGCKPELYHHKLVQRSQDIRNLENSVKDLTSQLASYQSLPPNEALTILKIKEAQEELKLLNQKLQSLLDRQ